MILTSLLASTLLVFSINNDYRTENDNYVNTLLFTDCVHLEDDLQNSYYLVNGDYYVSVGNQGEYTDLFVLDWYYSRTSTEVQSGFQFKSLIQSNLKATIKVNAPATTDSVKTQQIDVNCYEYVNEEYDMWNIFFYFPSSYADNQCVFNIDIYFTLIEPKIFDAYVNQDSVLENMYTIGFGDGYGSGYNTGKIDGYNQGYNVALANHDFSFTNLFASISDTPILFLRRMFNFGIFGVSAISILFSLFTCLIFIKIIKRFF